MNSRRSIILDTDWFLHREMHGVLYKDPTDEEIVKGAVFSLGTILRRFNASRFYVVLDGGELSERRLSLYPGYKQHRRGEENRSLDPDRFLRVKNLFASRLLQLNCRVFWLWEHEADDIISMIVQRIGGGVVISGDRDLYQLCTFGACVYTPGHQFVAPEFFEEKVGVPVCSFLLYKALQGDRSDGITGVPNIGKSRAKKILSKYRFPSTPQQLKERLRPSGKVEMALTSSWDIVDRNVALMDLTEEPLHCESKTTFGRLLESEVQFDEAFATENFGDRFGRLPGWLVSFRALA